MRLRRIDVVLFDLDDTLHDDTAAYRRAATRVAEEVSAERGLDSRALNAAYVEAAEGFWSNLSNDDLTVKMVDVRKRLWARALARLGVVDDTLAARCARDYNAYRRGYFALFPGVRDFLLNLRRQGKRIGLVTNGFAETHHDKITELNLRDVLDAIFIADEIGMVKPDPRLFAHACETLGAPPERSAMVGDRYERDIRGAIEAGLFTIWVNVRDEELPPGAPPPDAVCRTILEVEGVLEAASLPAAHGS
ncbi:MAG TPA: HAD-IA family hydrolase [Candidatus Tyrphobacter sp.]